MIEKKDILPVGKFKKTHALRGELNVMLEIEPRYYEEGNPMIVDYEGIYVPFYVEGIRPKGANTSLVKLDGVNSEEEARRFVNKTVYALKSTLAPFLEMEESEIMTEDEFCGYKVIDSASGLEIGEVERIDSSTSNMLFILNGHDGVLYIPVVENFIRNIDADERKITMSLPDGLLDLNKKRN